MSTEGKPHKNSAILTFHFIKIAVVLDQYGCSFACHRTNGATFFLSDQNVYAIRYACDGISPASYSENVKPNEILYPTFNQKLVSAYIINIASKLYIRTLCRL